MPTLRDRTVLVTGAGGFVGRHLARTLLEAGARLVGLGIEPTAPQSAFERWLSADLRDAERLRAALREARPQAIVHLAGQSSAARSFEHPVETFEINVRGTWNLLEAVRLDAPRARLLVVASGEVYGALKNGERATEKMPFRPVNPYGFSKAAADAVAEQYGHVHGLAIVRTRSFNHTGSGQDTRFVMPSFARQIAAIERGKAEPILKVGNLDVVRDFSDVRDIAAGYVALLERGHTGAAYNVCRGEGVRLADFVETLVSLAKVDLRIEPDPARMRPSDIPWLVGDPAAIEHDTGWCARIPLAETLAAVLDDARAAG